MVNFIYLNGNGFPVDHPNHNDVKYLKSTKDPSKPPREWRLRDRYLKTMAAHKLYTDAGYTVCFVWEHEFAQATRRGSTATVQSVCRWKAQQELGRHARLS